MESITSPTVERVRLILLCSACTRFQRVYGDNQADCQEVAYQAGWRQDGARLICPKCPAAREATHFERANMAMQETKR